MLNVQTNNHFHHEHSGKLVVNQDNKTLLGAVYKLCLVCLLETLKLIGETLNQVKTEPEQKRKTPPMPRRTQSRVIRVNKVWMKQSNKKKDTNESEEQTCTPLKYRRRSKSLFGRSLNISRKYLGRRSSYPPFRTRLEMVVEEE